MAKPEAAVQAGGLTKITKRKGEGGMEIYREKHEKHPKYFGREIWELELFQTIVCSRSFICDVDFGIVVPQRGSGDPAEKTLRVEFAHGVKRRCWQTLVHSW